MAYSLIKHSDADSLLQDAEELLIKDETEHNLILGALASITNQRIIPKDPLFFSIHHNNEFLGCFLRTHSDRPILLSKMPPEACKFLAQSLTLLNIRPNEVLAPLDSCTAFLGIWNSLTQSSSKTLMHQGVYQLNKLEPLNNSRGHTETATKVHSVIVKRFCLDFLNDCFPERTGNEHESQVMTQRHLDQQSMLLWKNETGDIVAMAAKARESRNGATVSLVYTPPEFRGRGYGTAITHAVTKQLLASGKKFCNLFTDLSNPTSNSIYQKIGYQKVGESQHSQIIYNNSRF